MGVGLIRRDGEIFRDLVHHRELSSVTKWSVPAPTIISLMKKTNTLRPSLASLRVCVCMRVCACVCVCTQVTLSQTWCCAGCVASGSFYSLSLSRDGSPSSFQVLTFLLFSPLAPSPLMPNPAPSPLSFHPEHHRSLYFCARGPTDDQTPARQKKHRPQPYTTGTLTLKQLITQASSSRHSPSTSTSAIKAV